MFSNVSPTSAATAYTIKTTCVYANSTKTVRLNVPINKTVTMPKCGTSGLLRKMYLCEGKCYSDKRTFEVKVSPSNYTYKSGYSNLIVISNSNHASASIHQLKIK
jgi:hypothetical protein